MPQMNEGVRPSLPIMGRRSRADETDMLIERERLWVLLIHIGCQLRMGRDGSRYEGFADPFSMLIRVDKQCLQMTVMQKHETLRRACGIDCKLQAHLWEELHKLGLNGRLVVGRKEVMSGVDRPTPYLHDARQVLIC